MDHFVTNERWHDVNEHNGNSHQQRDEADLDVVFRRGDWRSWKEAVEWLRTDGMDDSELSPDEARHLIEELESLEHRGMAFTDDPRLAAMLVRAHRLTRC